MSCMYWRRNDFPKLQCPVKRSIEESYSSYSWCVIHSYTYVLFHRKQRSIGGRTHRNSSNLDWLNSIENSDDTSSHHHDSELCSRKLDNLSYFVVGNTSCCFGLAIARRHNKHSWYSCTALRRFCQTPWVAQCTRNDRWCRSSILESLQHKKETSECSSFLLTCYQIYLQLLHTHK